LFKIKKRRRGQCPRRCKNHWERTEKERINLMSDEKEIKADISVPPKKKLNVQLIGYFGFMAVIITVIVLVVLKMGV
jgi:hypothetical protein